MVPEPQLMMPRVLRCDLEGVRTLLHQLESESNSEYHYIDKYSNRYQSEIIGLFSTTLNTSESQQLHFWGLMRSLDSITGPTNLKMKKHVRAL